MRRALATLTLCVVLFVGVPAFAYADTTPSVPATPALTWTQGQANGADAAVALVVLGGLGSLAMLGWRRRRV